MSAASIARRALVVATLGAAVGAAVPATAGAAGVKRLDVSFSVRNVNRSALACVTDGKRYTIRGSLVGPRAALSTRRSHAATLYLHGLSFGRWLFDLQAKPGNDYAQRMARRGQVSLVVDRLGYDSSSRPPGSASCLGGQADIAHQLVQHLRSGDYRSSGRSPRFARVALAGHSVGGLLAQLEAYSFRDVDGLAVIAYSDLGSTVLNGVTAATAARACQSGGMPADDPAGPGGYAFYGQTPQDFTNGVFEDAGGGIVAAARARRNRDPCGDLMTFNAAVAADLQNVGSIRVPALVVGGADDPLFAPAGRPLQQALLTGSDDVTVRDIPRASHAISLERSAPQFEAAMDRWLSRRGFGGRPQR